MNSRLILPVACAAALAIPASFLFAGAARSDLPPQEKRQPVVDLAASLSHPVDPPPLPADLKSPFSFDTAAPESAAVAGKAGPQPAQKAARDTLEAIADSLATQNPNILFLGEAGASQRRFLIVGSRRYAVGDRIPIKFEGNTLDIEVTAIPNTTTYSLGYNGETTTRATRRTATK